MVHPSSDSLVNNNPTPSRAKWAPSRPSVRAGLFDIRRHQGGRNRQWDARRRPTSRRNLRRSRRQWGALHCRLRPRVSAVPQANTPAYGGKIAALEPKKLTHLFLTHLHFDHTEGLTEFMLSPWIYFREGPVNVGYRPPGTEAMSKHLTEAYIKDIDLQMFGLELLNATGYRLAAKDVLPGEAYKDKNVRITASQNHHGSWDYSYAYRVVTYKPDGTVDRTIVFSGDTSLFPGMEEVYAGADILFHEAYSYDPKTNPYDAKAPVSIPYMNAFHTSTENLAGVLKKVNPKVTVLYHYVTFTPANATDQERGVKEIKQFGYNGVVIQSQDADDSSRW